MTAVEETEVAPRCACCGTYAAATFQPAQPPALLAVCDVLVIWALESVGKIIVRNERSRYRALGTRPWHQAHTLWKPTAIEVDKGLKDSWDIIPAMLDVHGCCGVTSNQVKSMIDKYVRDLLITGTAHNVNELRYRFEAFLGVPIPPVERAYRSDT